MKTRLASLTILCLALAAPPAWAQGLYNNGPINGTSDAWTIDFGYMVSDSFTVPGAVISGFQFGVWEFAGDAVLSVDWSIDSEENAGTRFGSGTASVTDKFISLNQYGYNIDLITVTGLNVNLNGGTYWLTLQNAVLNRGDPVFWDQNSGVGCSSNGCPSLASEGAIGTLPSEAFTINGSSGTTPEPSSIMLFGSGILGLAGILCRKLF